MKKVGIVGFGNFGQFMTKHLKKYFEIIVFDSKSIEESAKRMGVSVGTKDDITSCDIVIFAVPVQYLEVSLLEFGSRIKPGALVVDVSSVKVKPVELMTKLLAGNVQILATHPLFGPQSGKIGINGLKIVVSPVRVENFNKIKKFLAGDLGLTVLEKTPEEHDRGMAYVQGLTHYIGKAISDMKIPSFDVNTPNYDNLLKVIATVKDDSPDLFYTLQKENPFAGIVREEFIVKLESINSMLDENTNEKSR